MTEQLWRCEARCSDCGHVLNTAERVPESEKGHVGITGYLQAGKCPKGCRSTFSDLNLNVDMVWLEVDYADAETCAHEWRTELGWKNSVCMRCGTRVTSGTAEGADAASSSSSP